MSPFVVLALFAQACLIQSVMSQQMCGGCGQIPQMPQISSCNPGCGQASYAQLPQISQGYGQASYSQLPISQSYSVANSGLSVSNQGNAVLSSVRSASCGSYGGTGPGQVGVAGDISADGTTCVVGAVPVMGAVDFCGTVSATGSVSLSGQCGCSCQ